jgi:hypothetical protein
MRGRRLRATFLLRTVILVFCVGIFVAGFFLLASTPLTLAAVVFLVVFWFVGIELGILPMLIEHYATKAAGEDAHRGPSLWFVDLAAKERERVERLREGTKENPSLW